MSFVKRSTIATDSLEQRIDFKLTMSLGGIRS